MKSNIPPFTPGQKVVCVKGSPEHGLYTGKTYILSAVYPCGCGSTVVQYGAKTDKTKTKTTCHGCCRDIGDTLPEWACSSERFAPLQEQTAPLLTFEKIKETEKEEILIMN